MSGRALFWTAVAWSLFQLWYASPLPFIFGVFILNDTEARSIHLAFALLLAFLAYPGSRGAPRDRVPAVDWTIGLLGAFVAAYIFLFYVSLSTRPGQPNWADMVVGVGGLVILLEATRRALGPPLVVVALVFLAYTFLGPYMPEVIQHKGASVERLISHQWLTTEGVFGVALGVSTGFVFLYVLFGSLLEQAGAGNWMMQVSFAMMGHLKGGPAKVAVVSSALNGVISGSSISNVVSGGIFTIPMMKRTGLTGVKAGAIETASSINGQIMPPVMGAAAFLMVEYVGIPYPDIVKHAALPAIISYIGLFYIVHIEALKIGAEPLTRAHQRAPAQRVLVGAMGLAGTVAVICGLYYAITGIAAVFGAAAPWIVAALGIGLYVGLLAYAARFDDLLPDDPHAPVVTVPATWPIARTGLHFILPIVVLLWCLMVEELSAGLSAFWATVTIMAMLATQRPLIELFRGGRQFGAAAVRGIRELIEGLHLGARNMIGIGVATATAGIVVGTVTLTGMGLMMTEFVELLSGGNVILMLVLTAFVSLILGMGIPTTANYILVATLMAPVIVELGAQAGLAIPLIAVHLFVFYFGIMADVTPPVGLAAYAAAAISGEDPIKTGFQGAFYSLRTALLPFIFVFEPRILLIDIHAWWEVPVVAVAATIAMMLFAAGTMSWFLVKSRLWESAALLLAAFVLLRPSFFWDMIHPPYQVLPPAQLEQVVAGIPEDGRMVISVSGTTIEGDDYEKTVSIRLGPAGPARERLATAGLRLAPGLGGEMQVAQVRFSSYAKKAGLEAGQKLESVRVPTERPSPFVMMIPALGLAGLVTILQWMRRRATSPASHG
ncbi:TRAP transporter permease [Desertibaculum subflavum]|uniref:TRAP transporter permease n=1 Tax=Desertibaculum subflavum TaxID=2268458 RepID=UPI0013C530EB